jgi:hypothetical protein
MILDHGLAVVIDLHPESDFKARLAKDDEFVERFADFWRRWPGITRVGMRTACFWKS